MSIAKRLARISSTGMTKLTTVERAFEIARRGEATKVSQLIEQLRREGYADASGHLDGAAIRKQLKTIMRAAKAQAGK